MKHEEAKFHPLVDMDTEGEIKVPMFFAFERDKVTPYHKLYLEELIPYRYRLCSTVPMTAAETEKLDIRCPFCGATLTAISHSLSETRHSLYICRRCDAHRGD